MIRQEGRSSERVLMELKTELVINENIYESNIENLSKNGLKVYAERVKEEVDGYPFTQRETTPWYCFSQWRCNEFSRRCRYN